MPEILFDPNPACNYRHDYEKIISDINQLLSGDRFSDAHDKVRQWALDDLFFYLHFILRVGSVNHPWLLERIVEVQGDNDGTMDLWSRGHYKCGWENSQIWMADGTYKLYKDVEPGEYILGYESGHSVSVKVVAKTPAFQRVCYKIKLRSGRETICGIDHPFLAINGLVEAKDLNEGDFIAVPRDSLAEIDDNQGLLNICNVDFRWDQIVEISYKDVQTVYDMQVGGDNLYIADGIITHNSTIITYGLNLWEVTKDPEQRIGIFSHTRGISKSFLRRIKHTCETNPNLHTFFPEVFWKDPKSEALKWSEDDGLIFKRQGAWQEATFEAWGLVDAQPTSKHFTVLNMDDVVTVESVSTPDQVLKVEDTFRVALNLCDTHSYKKRLIGTHYSHADLYSTQEKTGAWKVRRRLCTTEGVYPGTPVLMSQAELLERRKLMGIYVFNCQMLLNPVSEENQVFQRSWLRYYRQLPDRAMNLYLFCDPASGRKEKIARSDFTVMWLWGLDPMKNLYLVDMIRDRLNLTGRWKALKGIMKKWPKIQRVYYEQYGLQADVEHFESRMRDEGIYFIIEELGGKLAKTDRIQKLVPLFEAGKVYLPEVFYHPEGKRDLVKEFIEEEYLTFPFSVHDDMLDAASRLMDEKTECYYPEAYPAEDDEESEFGDLIQLSDWSQRKANSRYANT